MDENPSRADRRAESRKRSRVGIAIGAGIVVVILAVVGVLAFSGGGDDGESGDDGSASQSVPNTNVELQAGDIGAESAGPPVTVTAEQSEAVISTIGKYLAVATVDPLRTAQPAADLSGVFDTGALARVTGVDRAAMIDEGLPKVTGDLDVVSKPVAITGLGDQAGNLTLVTAAVDLDIQGNTGRKTPLTIRRAGYLVLSPDATGAWKVTAYGMAVTRDGGGLAAASTTITTETAQ